jgi:hypothetical protein
MRLHYFPVLWVFIGFSIYCSGQEHLDDSLAGDIPVQVDTNNYRDFYCGGQYRSSDIITLLQKLHHLTGETFLAGTRTQNITNLYNSTYTNDETYFLTSPLHDAYYFSPISSMETARFTSSEERSPRMGRFWTIFEYPVVYDWISHPNCSGQLHCLYLKEKCKPTKVVDYRAGAGEPVRQYPYGWSMQRECVARDDGDVA